MLSQVRIQNYALIDDIRLEFSHGLNVLTGETGAGKSILIDALRLCFGDRADSIPFKNPSQSCILETVVDFHAVCEKLGEKNARSKFSEFLGDDDELLIFRREFSAPGKSRNTINGRLVNLSQVRSLASSLLDWHGQYDFQAIFEPAAQLEMLDRYAKTEDLLTEYQSIYSEYAKCVQSREELLNSIQNRDAQIDLLKFQVQEIDRIKPEVGEDIQLKSEWIRFSHAEKLHEKTKDLLEKLDDGDASVSDQISAAFKPLIDLEKIDPEFSKKREALEAIQLELEEWIREARNYQESLSFDEKAAREAESRLNSLDILKRKYGGTLEAVCMFFEIAKKKLELLEDSDLSLKELEKQVQLSLKKVKVAGQKLSEKRLIAAQKFSKKICTELEELGMKQAQFNCRISVSEPGPSGTDHLEFDLAPNAGLPAQPLSKIASGGEASRVMLAIKKIAGDSDRISTLVFDEIDANIGGRLGSIVGQKLREIAVSHQVLLITHLPQIAAYGERHLRVVKMMRDGQTKISYEVLDKGSRVKELAQMMSGQEETAIAIKHAKELLEIAGIS